jgi:hypothetical protein
MLGKLSIIGAVAAILMMPTALPKSAVEGTKFQTDALPTVLRTKDESKVSNSTGV